MPETLNAYRLRINVYIIKKVFHFKKKMMDLQVFTHRSSTLTKSLKRLEDNSLMLLLCNHLLEKEENVWNILPL